MTRHDINRSGELEVFTRVVELGSFSAAGRALLMTPSAVSKLIARLEQRLGVKLLQRSTRLITLTQEGCKLYHRATSLLAELDELEQMVGTNNLARGTLHVNTNVPFGRLCLLPIIEQFTTQYPEIILNISMTDEVVNVLEKRVDVAIRTGPLKDSNLIARKLGTTKKIIVATPSYLKKMGHPMKPEDLLHHNLLGLNYLRAHNGWPFIVNNKTIDIQVNGNVKMSDGDALYQMVLAGIGISRHSEFQIKKDIERGRLIPLLEDYNPGDTEEMYAVYSGDSQYLPHRVRVFLDFLATHIQL